MSDATTVVGPQTHIVGNLRGDEDLLVCGRVDGSISLSRALTVQANGIVVANVDVERAVISGTVVGNVTAADVIHIQPEGRVVGDLVAARVVLADGASFRGKVEMAGLEKETLPQPPVAATPAAKRSVQRVAAPAPHRRTPVSGATAAGTQHTPRPKTAAGRKVSVRRR